MLDHLVAFCDMGTVWINEQRAVDVVYLDFSGAFDTVSQNILLVKLRKRERDEWTVRWTETWLIGRAWRFVINGAEPT